MCNHPLTSRLVHREGAGRDFLLEPAPELVDRRLWLDAYVDTYAQRDLRDLAQVGDVAAFVRVMKLAALRTGGLINHADLAYPLAGYAGQSPEDRIAHLAQMSVTVLPALVKRWAAPTAGPER